MVHYGVEVANKGEGTMQTLEILIEEHALGAVRPMEVAAHAPLSALVPAIVEELKLPQADLFGNRLVYMLRYPAGGPILPDDKSLAAAGVHAGAKLALDSYVMDGSVAALILGNRAAAEPAFNASATVADASAFPALDRDTSASLPSVRRKKGGHWTRRAFLTLSGSVLGLGTVGLAYAAYRSIFTGAALTKQAAQTHVTPRQTQPAPAKPFIPAGAKAALIFAQHQQTVRSVTWSPDGMMLASGANDALLLTWNLDGAVRLQSRLPGPVRAVAWSSDGQQLVAGAANQVTFFNALTGALLAQSAKAHTGTITALAWSPRQSLRVVSGALDKQAIVWSATTYMPETIFTLHTTGIESASWAGDGQTIATSSFGGVVRVWNANNGQQVHGFFMDAQLPTRAVAFASTSNQLAVGGDDGIVRFWNGLTCQQEGQSDFGTRCLDVPQRLPAHTKVVRTLAWSPDGRLLATGGDDGELAIWYPAQSQMPLLKVPLQAPVLALAWSPSGRQIATASGNTVTIWGLY